jgi:dihydrofolate reductase
MSNIILIVATDLKNGIGKNNSIPWKTDLDFFKKVTTGHVVIMGKNTWNSLPNKPLTNRENIIISTEFTDGRWSLEKDKQPFFSVKSLTYALSFAEKTWPQKDIFIIGGNRIYKSAMETGKVNGVLLTRYALDAECDVFFPFTITELEQKFQHWKTIEIDNTRSIPFMRNWYWKE